MLPLEVLQFFPTQQKALLSSIGMIDPNDTGLITFDLEQLTSKLPSHVTFQIKVLSHEVHIFQTVIDEGASTCVMCLGCWKGLGSPTLKPSNKVLKSFYGHPFPPHGLMIF